MKKENYERISLDITEFDVEDVITTSGTGGGDNPPAFDPHNPWELPVTPVPGGF